MTTGAKNKRADIQQCFGRVGSDPFCVSGHGEFDAFEEVGFGDFRDGDICR
jgi:hypothetical protein